MPDTKVSDLAAITTLESDDVLYAVDVSAGDTGSKKIQLDRLAENINVQNRIVNVIDPKYGADRTGVADSATAFQNAIGDLPTGGIVFVPDGRYRLASQIEVDVGGISIIGQSSSLAPTVPGTRLEIDHSGTGILVNSAAGMFNSEFADGSTNLMRGFRLKNLSMAAGNPQAGSGAPSAARGLEVRNVFEQCIVENVGFRGFTFCAAFFNQVWNLWLQSCTVRGSWPPNGEIYGTYGFWGFNANSVCSLNTYVTDMARETVGFRWMGAEAGTMLGCQTDQVGTSVWVDDNIGKFALSQHWVERCRQRYPGQVVAYDVTAGGSGYTSAPTVSVGAPGANGIQATAVTLISGGAVSKVLAVNPGSDYSSAPSVTINGGGGSGATATAVITDNDTGADMTAPLLIATNCEGVEVERGHLIWGGDPVLGETILGSSSYVWTYNATDVELRHTKLIGGGLINNGIMVAVARGGSDRVRIHDSCTVEKTGFRSIGRQNELDGTYHIPFDDEFGAVEFPDDYVIWLPAKAFDICEGAPTFGPIGTSPNQVNVWSLPNATETGVQCWSLLPQNISRQNRVLTATIHYATSTAAGNDIRLGARPTLFALDDDFRSTVQLYRVRAESTTANGVKTDKLTTTVNWSVALSNDDVAANIGIFRDGADVADTSTGIVYIFGVELRVQKADWEA